MGKVKKLFGENPETIMVLETPVSFDEDGVAEVECEEVLAVLNEVGGYEVLADEASEEAEAEAKAKEEAEAKAKEEAEAPSEEAPKATKVTPKRNVPKAD